MKAFEVVYLNMNTGATNTMTVTGKSMESVIESEYKAVEMFNRTSPGIHLLRVNEIS